MDPRIRGAGAYISVGLGIDVIQPYLDGGVGLISMIPDPMIRATGGNVSTSYKLSISKVNKPKLVNDILSGKHNGWIIEPTGAANIAFGGMRAPFAMIALKYALIYEDIMSDYENN